VKIEIDFMLKIRPIFTLVICIVEHFLNGYLSENTLLWSEGRTQWQPLSSISELWDQINPQRPDSSSIAGITF
jgi:hypothetical protein